VVFYIFVTCGEAQTGRNNKKSGIREKITMMGKNMKNRLTNYIGKLHRNESGDVPVGTMLIIALIVIPLLFLLISFKDEIVGAFTEEANAVLENKEDRPAL